MADQTQKYRCTACPQDDREFAGHTWNSHAKSKKHQENGGDEMSYELVNETPAIEVEEEEIEVPPIPERPELTDDDLVAMLEASTFEDLDDEPVESDELTELRMELARVEAERDEANRRAEQWRPDVDVAAYSTPEEAYAFMGRERLVATAEASLAQQNKDRIKRGLPPLYSGEPAEYKRLIEEEIVKTCRELVDERTKWVNTKAPIPMRTLKMVKPDGNVVQIPVEAQINNGAASLYDPIARYKEKGFKLPSPTLCNLRDCHAPSAVTNGKYDYQGYCSRDHMFIVEGNSGSGRTEGGETRMIDLAARV